MSKVEEKRAKRGLITHREFKLGRTTKTALIYGDGAV